MYAYIAKNHKVQAIHIIWTMKLFVKVFSILQRRMVSHYGLFGSLQEPRQF